MPWAHAPWLGPARVTVTNLCNRMHRTDSPEACETSWRGCYDCYGKGRKGNQGGVDDLVSATRLDISRRGFEILLGIYLDDISLRIFPKRLVAGSGSLGCLWTGIIGKLRMKEGGFEGIPITSANCLRPCIMFLHALCEKHCWHSRMITAHRWIVAPW